MNTRAGSRFPTRRAAIRPRAISRLIVRGQTPMAAATCLRRASGGRDATTSVTHAGCGTDFGRETGIGGTPLVEHCATTPYRLAICTRTARSGLLHACRRAPVHARAVDFGFAYVRFGNCFRNLEMLWPIDMAGPIVRCARTGCGFASSVRFPLRTPTHRSPARAPQFSCGHAKSRGATCTA
jgi:hypothetical protein